MRFKLPINNLIISCALTIIFSHYIFAQNQEIIWKIDFTRADIKEKLKLNFESFHTSQFISESSSIHLPGQDNDNFLKIDLGNVKTQLGFELFSINLKSENIISIIDFFVKR